MSGFFSRILVAGALLVPVNALAVPIKIDFTITATSSMSSAGIITPGGSYAGYPTGTLGGGYIVFDDSIGAGTDTINGRPTLDLEFSWLGQSFTEATAGLWLLNYGPTGLIGWGIGRLGADPGCGMNCSSSVGPTDFSLLNGGPPTGAAFGESGFMHVDGFDGFMRGSIAWTMGPAPVPEPATLGMLGLGLLGLAASRRKRRA